MATKTVLVSWEVGPQNFAPGTALGAVHVELGGGLLSSPMLMEVASGNSATFPDIPEEAESDPFYTYTIQQMDAAGNPLGTALTGAFSVLAPPAVVLDVPSVVTITVT